tara:strand:+ start:2090 stop:2383 length:294 start_codon:yes stop_codon:yes gene_type:complete
MSTRRAYKNGQLTDGFDMEGLFNNLGKQPKMILKTYNPITNKKKTLSNRDFKKLFQPSSSNSLETNLKQLLKKSKKTRQRKSGTKRRRKRNKSRKRN